jgi:hypothetical protein
MQACHFTDEQVMVMVRAAMPETVSPFASERGAS